MVFREFCFDNVKSYEEIIRKKTRRRGEAEGDKEALAAGRGTESGDTASPVASTSATGTEATFEITLQTESEIELRSFVSCCQACQT